MKFKTIILNVTQLNKNEIVTDSVTGTLGRLAYTKFTRDSFRDLGAFWKRRDSRVNWVRFEAGRDSQREFTR